MPRMSAAKVKCPRPEHAGSRIEVDGTYGRPGHRRQRYKCSPHPGGKPHVFTELLPREESWHRSCEHCERRLERRGGPEGASPLPVRGQGNRRGAASGGCRQQTDQPNEMRGAPVACARSFSVADHNGGIGPSSSTTCPRGTPGVGLFHGSQVVDAWILSARFLIHAVGLGAK